MAKTMTKSATLAALAEPALTLDPDADTAKTTLAPGKIDWLYGCCVIWGGTPMDKIAVGLNTVPTALRTSTA